LEDILTAFQITVIKKKKQEEKKKQLDEK